MNSKTKNTLLISLFFIGLILLNYHYLDTKLQDYLIQQESIHIDRVIDGDTIVSNKTHIRMLGMNAPETTKKEKYSEEAKEFLNDLILNKTVQLEFGKQRTDRYKRTLAYIYLNGKNINLELVENGLANFYFPEGKDRHYNEFKQAWQECIDKNINLCKSSENKCAGCIKLKEFNYNKQKIIFHNNCSFDCDLNGWDIKDEGRKHFKFSNFTLHHDSDVLILIGEGENNETALFWKGQKYVWTKTGDTLFLRDNERNLVLWRSY